MLRCLLTPQQEQGYFVDWGINYIFLFMLIMLKNNFKVLINNKTRAGIFCRMG